MPDKWGRVTYNDFNGITQGLQNIQAMNQRNTLFNQQQADRAEQTQFKENYESNLAAMNAGPQQARPYEVNGQYVSPEKLEQPVAKYGSASSQSAALGTYAKDQENKQKVQDTAEQAEVKEIANHFVSNQWDSLPAEQKKRYSASSVAMGQAVAGRLVKGQDEGKQAIDQVRQNKVSKGYAELLDYREKISMALKKGDKHGAGVLVGELSKTQNLPYKYTLNPETGNFKEGYLHSGSGKHEDNPTEIPFDEAVNQIMTVTPDEYKKRQYDHLDALVKWNEEARIPVDVTPGGRGQYYKKDGKEFYIFPQKATEDGIRQDYIVLDENNKETIYKSMADLQKDGFRYRDLNKEKAEKDLEVKDAALKSHNRANQNKGVSTADLKYQEEQAEKDIASRMAGVGAQYDPENRMVIVPSDKNGKPKDMNVLGMIGQSGFSFTTGKPVMTKDKWGRNNEYGVPVYLGAFDQKKAGGGQPQEVSGEKPKGGLADLVKRAKNTKPTPKDPVALNDAAHKKTAALGEKEPVKPESKPKDIKEVGKINGKIIARSENGYLIKDKDGWREPTKAETEEIQRMARKGGLTGSQEGDEWQYKTKYPGASKKNTMLNWGKTSQVTPSGRM